MKRVWPAVLVALAVLPSGAASQLAERVTGAEDGPVRFTFDARDDVEVCQRGVRTGGRHTTWSVEGRSHRDGPCRVGVMEVELTVRDGVVRGVEIVRRFAADSDARDLGDVDPGQAVSFLLSLAWEGASGDAAEDAIFPAAVADVPDVWRDLLEIARATELRRDVRSAALFWLGQEAAAAVTTELSDVALDRHEDQDIRDAAVFALSQRPSGESVPALITVARTSDGAQTRKRAMFWLAQTDDERVVAFFEDVLLGAVR